MPKKGQKLTEEQKAKMQAGRLKKQAAKATVEPDKQEEFEPTAVQQHNAQKAAEAKDNLSEPEVNPEAEKIDVQEEQVLNNLQLPTAPQVDPQLVASIVAATLELQRQNPQIAQATPEQKLEEIRKTTPQSNQPVIGPKGVQGVINKYPVEKSYYPDPSERLINEPKLARFAMKENYIFKWDVDGVEYEKNNIAYSEPRFTLELYRRLYNEDGEFTGKAALVARNILHEDQMTTRVAASKLGLVKTFGEGEDNMRELMDEVRYWRIQQWLFGIFTPPKVQTHRKRPTTQVIDGQVVEVYDTEELTDHDRGVSQAASLQSQTGVGTVAVPGEE